MYNMHNTDLSMRWVKTNKKSSFTNTSEPIKLLGAGQICCHGLFPSTFSGRGCLREHYNFFQSFFFPIFFKQ